MNLHTQSVRKEPGGTGSEARGRGGLGQTEVAMTDSQRRVILIVLGIAIFSASFFLSVGLLKLLD